MAEDWLADVRKYDPDADPEVVSGIVKHCGIALRNPDSALVSMSDAKEVGRVRDGFLKKKLALEHSDGELDAAILRVGERMKGDRTKNRVTVYYLLSRDFDRHHLFNKGAASAGTNAKAAATAAPAAPAAAPVAHVANDDAAARAEPSRFAVGGTGAAGDSRMGVSGHSGGMTGDAPRTGGSNLWLWIGALIVLAVLYWLWRSWS